ncbi:hypothetical protein PIB30_084729 [Stylosanthes scabra]|uniref:Uncharacterized protein n=1 Tax=Stylosanthes scabra TaxID=79078 RepID=A0ABU6TUX3_9FABA|nr:hypothetical protein [Stylosanthes scabra]
MSELVEVFLYNLGSGFTEIRKVGYRFLQRQANDRFVHLLVWLFNDEHVRVTFGCSRRLMPQHVMDFLVEVGGSPSSPPVAATPVRIVEPPAPEEGGECGADTPAARCPHYILPAPPPIPRLEDVPCFFQQFDLDEGACADPLKAGMGNDYNTDGGAEIRVDHRMRNREVTDAPRPLSRPVRNSLMLKTESIVVEESKPIVRLTAGFVNKKCVTKLATN